MTPWQQWQPSRWFLSFECKREISCSRFYHHAKQTQHFAELVPSSCLAAFLHTTTLFSAPSIDYTVTLPLHIFLSGLLFATCMSRERYVSSWADFGRSFPVHRN